MNKFEMHTQSIANKCDFFARKKTTTETNFIGPLENHIGNKFRKI